MILLGSLVSSRNNNLGVGKVIHLSDTQANVEYFCSVGRRVERSLPLESLSRVKLERQTRCYLYQESSETWIIGRVYEWDEDICRYQVDLPSKKTIPVSEREIYIRCKLPQADPIETLAMKGQETPYFHDRRFAFVKSLISQRAVSRGMTGLISANIKLFPHQAEVVRRVLEDPIQRYLLADEVGLGKTIEAGAILRQYLLDEASGYAVVIAPQYLLSQWRTELESKFYISHFPKRVAVLAVEDIHKINPKVKIGLLILDEAHHIAAMGTSKDVAKQKLFEAYRSLAHKCDRLLLLSATPVLHHEQDFLTMLHFLDPSSYKLNDLASFQAQVLRRQDIGGVLLSFKEDADRSVLKTNLTKLRHLFPQDSHLLKLADSLESIWEAKDGDQITIIKAIRDHISDTYRLHQRMLRNRRTSVEDVIFDRKISLKAEYDLDERSYEVHEIIEQWRGAAPNEPKYHQIFLLLFRASGTWLGILEQLIKGRLSGISSPLLVKEFGNESNTLITQTPKFTNEEEILKNLLQVIQQPSEDGDRLELLKIVILHHLCDPLKLQSLKANIPKLLLEVQRRLKRPIPGDHLPKIVVFTSFIQSCTEIIRLLTDCFGKDAVAANQSGQTRAQVEENLNRFQKNPNCFILVCDFSGEEGLNLQFVDSTIHFDIPWSPNRLEQRIGRVDRIGRSLNVEFTVFAGVDLSDSLHDAWFSLLKEGFKVFDQSIASFQFYVEQKLPALAEILLTSGAKGLSETIPIIQQEIIQEQVKINEQNALDEIDVFEHGATEYFQSLDDYDARHQEIQQVTEDWLCSVLHFRHISNPNISGAKRYQATERTLISANDLKNNFANALEGFGTFNRSLANQQPELKLYRIGEKLMESIFAYVNWDDRGKSYAMWRCDENWDSPEGEAWYGFRFNYVVETNITNYPKDIVNRKILQRRVDGLFPPFVKSIFIDARDDSMPVVQDERLLNILQLPYKSKGSRVQDYNLAKNRLHLIDEFVEPSKWQEVCTSARQKSLELLIQQSDFKELCQNSSIYAEQKLTRRLEQLRLRLNQFKEQGQVSHVGLEQELNHEIELSKVIIEGISHPLVRLDSVGFMVVSKRQPPQVEGDW